jgi:DNA-binding transcriptional MerR regulator
MKRTICVDERHSMSVDGGMNLTQMTERLGAVSPEKPETLNRQIRHWATVGVLPLTGERFSGTGRGRVYTEDALLVAAVAVELARWGIPIAVMTRVLEYLRFALDEDSGPQEVKKLKAGASDALTLVFTGRYAGQDGVRVAHVARDRMSDHVASPEFLDSGTSVVMIDLSRLWAKLR